MELSHRQATSMKIWNGAVRSLGRMQQVNGIACPTANRFSPTDLTQNWHLFRVKHGGAFNRVMSRARAEAETRKLTMLSASALRISQKSNLSQLMNRCRTAQYLSRAFL